MTDDYGMFSNLVPSVEEKEDDDYGMFADLVPSVDTKAKDKDYGMFADLVPSVETAVTPQLEAQSQAFKPIKVTPAKQGWGELGGWQNNEDGSVSTELTITVNHPELNNGMPTVIPTLVAGQDDLDGLLNFNITEQHEEVAVKRAIERQKDGMTWPSFINMDLANEFAKERSSNKTDNSFEFAADQAQKMFGRGAQVWAELSESEPMAEWAKEYVAQQNMEIEEGGYKSSYDRNSLRETFNEDGFGAALGYVGESIAENSVSSGVALASTGVAAVAVALSAPAWIPLSIGALTIAGSGTLGTGEAALEMEDKGVDVSNKKAAGVGILIGLLEKVGAGKVIPVGQLAEMSGNEIIKQLVSEGSIQAAKEFAKVFSKKVGSEVGTEIAQESAIIGAAASQGAEYDPLEVFDRLVDTAFISAGISGPVAAASTVSDIKQANNLAQSIDSTLNDINNNGGTDGSGSASGTPEIQDTTDAIIREADGSITSVVIPTPRSEPTTPDAPTSEAPDIATVEVDINAQRAELDDDLAAALTAVQAEPSTTVPAPFGDAVAPQVQPESLESMTGGLLQLEPDALTITADDMAQMDLDDVENQAEIDQEIAAFNASTAAIPTELPPVASVKKKLLSKSEKEENAARRKLVDPTKDDLLTAIAKIGGVRRGEASAEGFDPADFGMRKDGLKPVFRAKPDQGVSFDAARETLAQDGYIDPNTTVNDFADLLQKAVRGETVVSNRNENYIAQQDAERLDDYTQQGGVIPEAPAPQASVSSADQTLTSAIDEARNGNLPQSEIDSILTNYPKESDAVLQLQMSMAGVEIGDSSGSNQAARVGDLRPERNVQQGEGDRGLAGSSTDVATGSSNNESQNVTDAMGVLLSPSATSGNTNADSEAGSGGGINNAGLLRAEDAGSSSLDGSMNTSERTRIEDKLSAMSTKDFAKVLKNSGLLKTGTKESKIKRLVDAREGAEAIARFDSFDDFVEAVNDSPKWQDTLTKTTISTTTLLKWANATKMKGDVFSRKDILRNADNLWGWATASGAITTPRSVEKSRYEGESRQDADQRALNNQIELSKKASESTSFFERSVDPSLTQEEIQTKYEAMVASEDKRLVQAEKDSKAESFDLETQTEESSTTTLTEPVNGPTTEMPEDQGMKGASPKQTKDIAAAMEEHMAPVFDEEANTRVFEPPTNAEVVRLKNKVDEYVKDVGWLDVHQVNVQLSSMRRHAEHQNTPGTMAYAPDNRQKWVISLFDTSGAWSQPWVDAGYQVLRFDIQDEQLIEVQEGESVRTANIGDVFEHGIEVYANEYGAFNGEDVYAVLAACPCTDFASSGARHFAAKDADGRTLLSQEIVSQTMAIIEYLKPQVWALENPVGRIGKLTGLPQWRTSFDPYHFGDTYTKKTLLWGRHNGDMPIMPREPVEGSKMHTQYGGSSLKTKNARSVTPEGFAYAFFIANNANDNPKIDVGWKYDMLDQDNLSLAVDMEFTKADIAEQVEDAYYFDQDFDKGNRIVQSMINSHVVGKGQKHYGWVDNVIDKAKAKAKAKNATVVYSTEGFAIVEMSSRPEDKVLHAILPDGYSLEADSFYQDYGSGSTKLNARRKKNGINLDEYRYADGVARGRIEHPQPKFDAEYETQTEESFGLEAQTEETLAADADQRKVAATEQAAKEKTENDKIQADKEVGEFMLTGSDAPADIAMGFGQEGLFDNPPEAVSLEEDAKVDAYVEANAETKSDSTDGDMSQGDVLFSKSAILNPNAKPKGVTEAQIQARVNAFLAKYKGADNVQVWIRDTQDNAFGSGSTATDGPIKGGYYPEQDAVVFIAENIDSVQDIDSTIQHELLVHKGLGLFEESDVQGLIDVIKENAPESKSLKKMWEDVQFNYKDETIEIQAEELLAKVAEAPMSKPDKYWNKIVTYVRDMLRKLGFVKEISFSDLRKRVYDMGEAFAQGRQADRRRDFTSKNNETKSPSSDGLSASGMLKSKGDSKRPQKVVLKGKSSQGKASDVSLQGTNATTPSGGMRPGAPLIEGSRRPNAKVKNEKGTGKPDVTIYGVDADGKRLLTAKPRAGGWDIIIERKPNGEMFPNGKPLEVTAKNIKQVEQRIKMLGLEVENITNKDGPAELSVLDENHFEMPDATNFEWWRFNLQDKFINLKRTQDEIEKYTGEILPDEMNAYVKETLSHGKAEAQISLFHEETLKPLIKYMNKNELSLEDVSQYLYARHAEEANAFQEKQNAQRENNKALSGMSNETASTVMADFESRGKVQALVNIAKITDEVIKKTRKIMVKSGLQSQTIVDQWADTYDYYTPLWGDPADPDGKNIGGADVEERLGRESEADNVFVNLVVQHEKTIIAAEKNAVKRSLLRLAERNPNPNLWSIDKVEYTKAIDEVTGLVVDVKDNRLNLGNHIIKVRVDGVDTIIELNKENKHAANMALAFNGIRDQELNRVIKAGLMANRYFSMINTTWNPEFVLPNLARDLQTAVVNLNDTDARDVRIKILKNTWSSYRAIRNHQKGDRTSEESQWYDEFYKAGAQTGWIENYDSMKSRAAKIESMIARDKHLSLDTAHRMVELVSDVNTGVENSVRLSTYIELRKLGKSQDEAANIAKNLTVNFNRKGNQGPTANALYLFFNAAMQGTVRLGEAMKHKHVRRAVYKLVAFSAALDILNRLIGGEDEYEESAYDKIPDYVKRSNMIFMIPSSSDDTFDKGYIKIPMPYGYNVFQVIGSTLGETTSYMFGGKPELSATKQLERVRDSFIHAFNPVGSDASFLQFISPTLADPIIQIGENQNFSGSKIYPEQNPFGVQLPDSQLYWDSVPEPLKMATETLNSLGGDRVRSGYIDVSPETVQHIYQFATGGAGRFFYDLVSTPVDAVFNPEELDVRDIPFVRRLYGKTDARIDTDRFYNAINEVKRVQEDLKLAREDDDLPKFNQIKDDYEHLIGMKQYSIRTVRKIRKLRERLDKIEQSDFSEAEKKTDTLDTQKQMRTIMKKFYQDYRTEIKAAK